MPPTPAASVAVVVVVVEEGFVARVVVDEDWPLMILLDAQRAPLRHGCGSPTQKTGSAVITVVTVVAVVAFVVVDVVGIGGGAKVVAAVNAPTTVVVLPRGAIVVVVVVVTSIPAIEKRKGEKYIAVVSLKTCCFSDTCMKCWAKEMAP